MSEAIRSTTKEKRDGDLAMMIMLTVGAILVVLAGLGALLLG